MKNEIPLVSVIMSVYDGVECEHLQIAVDSILNQTFDNFDFIIVLDGVMRDDIKTYCQTLKDSDRRVRLICIPQNKGLANALNNAIISTNSEFIIRMDADDISYPNRIHKLVEHMISNKDLDVTGSFVDEFSEECGEKKIVEYPTKHEDMKKLFVKRNSIAHPSVIFRRSFFDKAGYYPLFSVRNEDTLLWLSGFLNGCRFSNLAEVLYSLRFNKETGTRRIGLRKSFSDLVDRLRVIIDLRAGTINIFYAIALFIIQNMPYSIYSYLRCKLVSRKNTKG